ncbi:MAG: twin-arginine translocase subunit TatC, partial [Deltaproteobacteria bacterium]|nr:twin-arginine translocase subunit TatC [Deltaproteobacteria bacterium]
LTFAIGAILTPPDVITQCMMAGPLIILYEIGILVSKKVRQKALEKDEEVPQKDEA